jgi:hypothetical protein
MYRWIGEFGLTPVSGSRVSDIIVASTPSRKSGVLNGEFVPRQWDPATKQFVPMSDPLEDALCEGGPPLPARKM